MVNAKSLDTTETFEFIGIRPAAPGARPPIRVEFAATSHPGKVRANNEDHFLVTRMGRTFEAVSTNMPQGALPGLVDEVAYGMVVADGMGGMAAGEHASQLAIRTGVELVLSSPMWATRVDDDAARQLTARLSEYFREVDSVVIGQAKNDRHLSGMGTTLTVAYIIDTSAFIVHVGDSRAYHFRKGKLDQLTRDHTMAQDLLRAGAIRPEDVQRHSKRHVLTNFVGGPSSGVEPEVKTVHLEDGDYLLLCSDGLTEMVKDEQISRVLDSGKPTDVAAKTLIDMALEAGGRDNVTVVLARFAIPKAS
jgi:serine/threonine protein phosphatase PrpC